MVAEKHKHEGTTSQSNTDNDEQQNRKYSPPFLFSDDLGSEIRSNIPEEAITPLLFSPPGCHLHVAYLFSIFVTYVCHISADIVLRQRLGEGSDRSALRADFWVLGIGFGAYSTPCTSRVPYRHVVEDIF